MIRRLYEDSFIIKYQEGDESLERLPVNYIPSINDKVHIIKENDTLEHIAFLYYKQSKVWYVIADVNEIYNPFVLTVGSSLTIPDLDNL